MKEAFAGRRARAVGVKARKVRHLSLGEKKRIRGCRSRMSSFKRAA